MRRMPNISKSRYKVFGAVDFEAEIGKDDVEHRLLSDWQQAQKEVGEYEDPVFPARSERVYLAGLFDLLFL